MLPETLGNCVVLGKLLSLQALVSSLVSESDESDSPGSFLGGMSVLWFGVVRNSLACYYLGLQSLTSSAVV